MFLQIECWKVSPLSTQYGVLRNENILFVLIPSPVRFVSAKPRFLLNCQAESVLGYPSGMIEYRVIKTYLNIFFVALDLNRERSWFWKTKGFSGRL